MCLCGICAGILLVKEVWGKQLVGAAGLHSTGAIPGSPAELRATTATPTFASPTEGETRVGTISKSDNTVLLAVMLAISGL